MDSDQIQRPPLDPTLVQDEIDARAALLAGDFSHWARAGEHLIREEHNNFPERLFLFRLGDVWLVGSKTISDLVVEHGLPGLFCSRVHWHNVLGPLTSVRTSDTGVQVGFRPLDEAARRAAFDAITPETELIHPFPKHRVPGQEVIAEGWEVNDHEAALLNLGEEHIRRYTLERFGPRFAHLTTDVVAYDPACSTGRFLADFASLNPERIRTVGQDLSPEMVEYAGAHLERVHVGDALTPAVAPLSVDIMFVRFLNNEVVSTAQARQILPRLAFCLKPGGTMVLLGHSPLLVDATDLTGAGLTVTQTVARQDGHVFQYYVCETMRLRSA
ncbi:class I SAM-dependent methyltransferase [Kutzneria sp. CA-103260]|uniref:class I SAM-dependent methyltransferase n=1 Tax=Kutzneria sp. CA-103260 TaxID=2802641 RepID=UPI001BA49693|nr:class I SAM-dependent methyltransferase [Kutzneria sp. CA-103260]QUQ62804.1 Methyltransferase domain protein [Kutzneria sp. CA-103260]